MLSLAWSMIRTRKGGFAAVFIAVFCGSAVITGSGILLDSGARIAVAPERYAGAAVVAGANQVLPVEGDDVDPRFAERVTLPADRAAEIAKVPGVRAAVGDVGFRIGVVTAGHGVLAGPDGFPAWGHGWSSAVLAPFTLSSGRPPAGPGEVVLDAGLAARAGITTGGSMDMTIGSVPSRYRVVGVVAAPGDGLRRQSAVFLADDQARAASGRPDRVDAVGVLADAGTDPDELAQRITAAVPGVVTYVGDGRADAEFMDVGSTRSFLTELAGSFGGSMAIVVIFVVASTLGLSLQQRRRELALLRAVGATPKQVRRMIGAETLVVSIAAAVLGILPAIAVSSLLLDAFTALGMIPADLKPSAGPLPMLLGPALCVVAARFAASIAARRSGKVSPVAALGEAAVEPRELGWLRLGFGVLLVPVSLGVAILVPLRIPGEAAVAAAAGSALLLVIAVALLGPRLLSGAVAVFGRLLGGAGTASGFLAKANARANSRRLSSATTPLIMGVTMAAVQIFTMTTLLAAAQEQARTSVVADYVLAGTTSGVSTEVADAAGAVPGVAAVTPVARTQTLVSYLEAGDPKIDPFSAQGVRPEKLADTMDLDIREGSIGDLKGDTVALSRIAAGTIGAGLGATVDMHLGDGTAVKPRVVAIYGNGLGFGDLTLPYDVVVAHLTDRLAQDVLVRAAPGADVKAVGTALRTALARYPTVEVADRASFAAAEDQDQENDSTVNLLLNALLLGYIAIAVVNTLVMATAARSREFALLRLVGASRAQVRAMMRGEARIVVVLSVLIGSLAAIPPLVGVSLGATESPVPSVSLPAYAGIVAVAALLGWGSIVLPARAAMRARPIDAIGIRE
jgi:putative ABC transport system permease protein